MNVAVIPARGGSKRIPRKNIKNFCGKPMIAHAIENALTSQFIDKVVVSTDDDNIADVALQHGAEVPFLRPKELADDYTGTSPVVRHAISMLMDLTWPINNCACIYATSPLLSPSIINSSYKTLINTPEVDYVFTAARFSFPIQRAILQTENGGVKPYDSFGITQRSQDLPPAFHDAGQLYWGHYSTWLNTNKHIFGANSKMVVMPDHLVQDIDTPEDWKRAELLYKLINDENAQ
ncbi:pseudaminic acid cytidylyltransferase [Alteromonas sp. KS69]|jgi:pseudaminic acid cytidylyltransferase|uniref:pseudaminic acid cytidylyltransferase n=1 Tax=Alteromonas sp. KS69 TaxID=2109917 RepID=UPI000F8733BD|nr:pseudaminic acid cytidylyltransferase [Alteromonas sp. KS69]RUP82636.1 pseudaminic acid cytidylyltransferase [Alteromonas sp. KS69]|tara:strand:+ start:9302 stop:10006 length:705 start_codon:yes stop_codon:yes gene_type:complete